MVNTRWAFINGNLWILQNPFCLQGSVMHSNLVRTLIRHKNKKVSEEMRCIFHELCIASCASTSLSRTPVFSFAQKYVCNLVFYQILSQFFLPVQSCSSPREQTLQATKIYFWCVQGWPFSLMTSGYTKTLTCCIATSCIPSNTCFCHTY